MTIRGLDDEVVRVLRERAARNGRSMEAEVRAILDEAVREPEDDATAPTEGTGTRIRRRFDTPRCR